LIAVGERNKQHRIIPVQEERSWVRTASERSARLAEFDLAQHFSVCEIEFRNCGGIPQRYKSPVAIVGDYRGVRQGSGYALVC